MVILHDKITGMYARQLSNPNYSFFLFGPRGTGKTTWLRERLPNALWKNLLLDSEYLTLLADPSRLSAEVRAVPKESWVVIDEIQRIPALLNEVHNMISEFGKAYKFAMSGSSARKLRRLDANLLAGRAIERRLFPLTSAEMGADWNLENVLRFGTLPSIIETPEYAHDILQTYVGTYLKQEIQQETLIADIAAFHRFLKVAAIMNGQVLNISSVARDAAVTRSTAERYFEILVDTLIGVRLYGWQPRLKVREKIGPKFYFFDPGIVRACTGRLHEALGEIEIGFQLETVILHELRAANSYLNVGGEIFYWRTPSKLEVDFIWERGSNVVAIEVKASRVWRNEYGKALKELLISKKVKRCFGVYLGQTALKFDKLDVLPLGTFLQRLHAGEIFD